MHGYCYNAYVEPTPKKQCPKCGVEISEADYFCPNCGNILKSKPGSTSVLKQVLVYSVSFFLAPLGLGYAFKYLRQPDRKSKMIGGISLALTVVAIAVVFLVARGYLEQQYRPFLEIGAF